MPPPPRRTRAKKKRSNTRRELVSNQILEQAASLFADRGFSDTSLQEVANALGISRTALYHYIGGKDELLATLVKGITRETAESLERLADDDSIVPAAKVREAVRGMVIRIANSPARFRLLLLSEGALTEKLAVEHRDARRRTLEALTRIIQEGIRSGALRPIDEHLAAFALLGMSNWVAWWYKPDRIPGQTPETLAASMAEMGLAALRIGGNEGTAAEGDGIEHAVELLRQDLDYLERALAATLQEGSRRRPTKARAAAE
jgi:AcrR family transcriptional regulator